jgi:hypothetical protein
MRLRDSSLKQSGYQRPWTVFTGVPWLAQRSLSIRYSAKSAACNLIKREKHSGVSMKKSLSYSEKRLLPDSVVGP